jgi:hypothetical protein
MRDSPSERPRLPLLKAVRFVIVLPILINLTLVALAEYVAVTALHWKYPKAVVTSVFFLASVTFTRLIWLFTNGCIQAATASVMIAENPNQGKSGAVNYRRVSLATLLLPRTQGTAIGSRIPRYIPSLYTALLR